MTFATLGFAFIYMPITVIVGRLINRQHLPMWMTLMSMLYIAVLNHTMLVGIFSISIFTYLCSLLISKVGKPALVAGISVITIAAILLRIIIMSQYRLTLPLYDAVIVDFTICIALSCCALTQISYILDLYRDNLNSVAGFFYYIAYSLYLPMLFVGPIYRYNEFEQSMRIGNYKNKSFKTIPLYAKGIVKLSVLASSLLVLWGDVGKLSYSDMTLTTGIIGIGALSLAVYYIITGYSDVCKAISELIGIPMGYNQNHFFACRTFSGFISRFNLSVSRWTTRYLALEKSAGNKTDLIMLSWMTTALYYGMGSATLTWGLVLTLLNVFERLVILPRIGNSRKITPLYTVPIIGFGFLFFGFFTIGSVSDYLIAMFRLDAGGIYNSFTIHIFSSNWYALLFGWLFCSTFAKHIYLKIRKTKLRVIVEFAFIVSMIVLMIAAVIFLLDTKNNPFIIPGGGIFG